MDFTTPISSLTSRLYEISLGNWLCDDEEVRKEMFFLVRELENNGVSPLHPDMVLMLFSF